MKPQELTALEMHNLMVDAHEAGKFFKANVFPEPYQSKNLIGLKGWYLGPISFLKKIF